ncbi:MAG: hypothetical protein HY077_10860 [Elusimicrobia bacterium]|nr:hypothetical protein [Elusimicrobiota bacterium]
MKTWKKAAWAALGLLSLALGLGVQRAQAAAGNPSYLNIDVKVTASLSVAVNGVNSSTYGVVTWNTSTPNQEFTAGTQGSSVTVKNDSNVVEKWSLSTNANSINTTGAGTTWAVSASSADNVGITVGADAFAMQAVFGSSGTLAGSCPANGAGSWNNGNVAKLLTTSLQQYTDTVFADSTIGGAGANSGANPDQGAGATSKMKANGKRVMCWRLIMPASTATTDQQNLQVIVTAS